MPLSLKGLYSLLEVSLPARLSRPSSPPDKNTLSGNSEALRTVLLPWGVCAHCSPSGAYLCPAKSIWPNRPKLSLSLPLPIHFHTTSLNVSLHKFPWTPAVCRATGPQMHALDTEILAFARFLCPFSFFYVLPPL